LQKAQPFLLNNSIINLFVIKQILLIITLLNLDVMKSTTHLSLEAIINVSNASKKQNSVNADHPVSSN